MKNIPKKLTITTTTDIIKSSHLVVLVQEKEDIENIPFITLEKKQKEQMLLSLKNKKETSDTFFLGDKVFQSLTVIYFFWENKEAFSTFLSTKFSSLGDNITLAFLSEKRSEELFDTFILSTTPFENYKSKKQDTQQIILVSDKKTQQKLEERYETLSNVLICRELGNTPACDLTPDIFVKKIKEIKWKYTKVKVLSSKDIQKKGLWLIHAVWKGSAHSPSFVVLERIINKKYPTIWFVWKGVIFDTGWLNLKLGDHMFEMKQDMNGAATVFTVMKELDRYKDLKINMIAALPLVENAIWKDAFRPSDIITSYTGHTVQVTNTDAEWRLVLADAVGYLSKNYTLSKIMTIATLTGACMVALGHRYAGIMWNDRQTIETIVQKSRQEIEKYNELPFDEYFIEKTKSKIADLDNWTGWPKAGATMGAAFIANFLTKNEPFTHIDIAGVSINSFEPYGHSPLWATGFWVLSLSSFFKSLS